MQREINNTKTGKVQVLRLKEVAKRLGISISKVYVLIEEGILPKPFTLYPKGRAVGLLESDINELIASRRESV